MTYCANIVNGVVQRVIKADLAWAQANLAGDWVEVTDEATGRPKAAKGWKTPGNSDLFEHPGKEND